MGGGKAPKPPDYVGAANAQGNANVEAARVTAALNRVNQVGPQGTVSYQQDPNNPDSFTQTTTLSPEQQALYNQNVANDTNRLGVAGQRFGEVGQQIGQGLNTNGLPQRVSNVQGGQQQTGVNAASGMYGRIQTGNLPRFEKQPGQQYQQSVANPNLPSFEQQAGQQYQKSVDFGGATQLPGNEDFGAERQRVEDSLYNRNASRLDDQFARRGEDQRAQLLNRGLREGTEAYANAERDLNQSRTDAYGDLRDRAVQAGGAEQARLFQQALAARQQGVGEELQQGQFANSAADAQNIYGLNRRQAAASERGQVFGEGLQEGQFANDAANLGNTYGLNRRQQAASERGQTFGENQAQAQFGNQATNDRFANELARSQLYNQAQSTQFGQGIANAQLQNNSRDQGIGEQQINQDQILQGLQFLYGNGYQQPQFASGADGAAGGVQAPDILGALNQQYGAQTDIYNANQARAAGNRQAGVGAATTIGLGAVFL